MRITYHAILYALFALFILSLPLNSLFDTIAYFEGTVGDKTYAKTPVAFKLFKDLFLGLVIIMTLYLTLRRLNKRLLGLVVLLVIVLLFAVLSVFFVDAMAVVLGVRSYLTIFFIFLGFYYSQFNPGKVYPFLKFLFFIELVIQILQFIYAPNYYGYVLSGFNLTNPGTFLIPSTMASYAILVHFYAREKGDKTVVFLSLVSVFLSRSSTAWLIVIIFYVILFSKKLRLSKDVLLFIIAVVGLFIYFNLDTVTGRPGIINNLITRMEIFADHLRFPLGKGFGLGSGAAVLFHLEGATIADSTINSLLMNFGWIGFLIYIYVLWISYKYLGYKSLLFISFAAFSLTMIVFEMTPFIQFYFFELGRAIAAREQSLNNELATT